MEIDNKVDGSYASVNKVCMLAYYTHLYIHCYLLSYFEMLLHIIFSPFRNHFLILWANPISFLLFSD